MKTGNGEKVLNISVQFVRSAMHLFSGFALTDETEGEREREKARENEVF